MNRRRPIRTPLEFHTGKCIVRWRGLSATVNLNMPTSTKQQGGLRTLTMKFAPESIPQAFPCSFWSILSSPEYSELLLQLFEFFNELVLELGAHAFNRCRYFRVEPISELQTVLIVREEFQCFRQVLQYGFGEFVVVGFGK